ncbi:PadR family transcriptional regulator [Sneathiella glossodoripedis]|uniref:PadR family transcriptional regulator n=1 Tax=Sneathiella glossodoripedis TaxID=418853 RepID=UPI00046E9844|nr:PadR family transcriptional regulator [Sneathiella glossodoripedis]
MDVRTLCLGILTFGDATGYEIKKAFEDRLGLLYDASFGSIYPALNKLTEQGLISCREESQDHRPDKKVYSVTQEGQLEFIKHLQRKPKADKYRSDTLATMMFAHLLSPGKVATLLDNYIETCEENIATLSEGCDMKSSLSEKFLCGFGIAVKTASINYIRENRHLIEAESLLADSAAE